MAKRLFCDRCGADVTDTKSVHLVAVDYTTRTDGGAVSKDADLCLSCYRLFDEFMQPIMRQPMV